MHQRPPKGGQPFVGINQSTALHRKQAEDGGYYDDWGNPVSNVSTGGGGFYIISSCKITASCNEGGTITPNGVNNAKKYSNQTYTIKATFEYPVNAESPLGKRCIYIPVETADGTYTLTFTVTAKNAAGEALSDTQTATVVVKGNMYEDDFTGDS